MGMVQSGCADGPPASDAVVAQPGLYHRPHKGEKVPPPRVAKQAVGWTMRGRLSLGSHPLSILDADLGRWEEGADLTSSVA